MSTRRKHVEAGQRRPRIFATDAAAWVAQGSALAAGVLLAVHGFVDGSWQWGELTYGIVLAVSMVVVLLVGASWLLRVQANSTSRLHPGACIVTAIANVQFVAQLKAVAQLLGVPAARAYSGTYYAIAVDSSAIWIVLGSLRPKDIIRIPREKCAALTVERVAQGVFMQNCIELHIDSGGSQLVMDLLLLRPVALATIPLGHARLTATAERLCHALQGC